ncbi:MAG: beta-lactamase class [Blastocatellia bacterium]|nr:beta-lactamase class [Blastocatellia bacterium]
MIRNKRADLVLGLLVVCMLQACTPQAQTSVTPQPTPTPRPVCAQPELRSQMEKAALLAQGKVGAAAVLLEGGEVVAINGAEHFPMQSVYKLPIGMYVLHQVDRGQLTLDQKIEVIPKDFLTGRQHSPIRDKNPKGIELSLRELLRFMVSESDGTACDVLLGLVGGPSVVTKYLREIGLEDIIVANTEREFGQDEQAQYRNWATPESALALLRKVHEGPTLSPASRSLLLEFLTKSPTGPRRIKGMLPQGTQVAHKTGSSGRLNDYTRALNDIGIITLPDDRHLALAVFVSDSKVDEQTLEGVIATIARSTWDCWIK